MNRKFLSIVIILAVGAVLAVMILQIDQPTVRQHEKPPGHSEVGERSYSEAEERSEDKGPHGGRMFSKDDLRLEVIIYDRNVPPQFRVYTTDAAGNNIPLDQIKLNIDLHRLERVDTIRFNPSGEYLISDQVITKPHSFDVKITAEWKGKNYQWGYSQIEARAQISEEAARNAGIKTIRAGPAEIHQVYNSAVKSAYTKNTSRTSYHGWTLWLFKLKRIWAT